MTCPATPIIELLSLDEHIPKTVDEICVRWMILYFDLYEVYGGLLPLRVTSLVDMKQKTSLGSC